MISPWEAYATTAGTLCWRYRSSEVPRIPDAYVNSVVYIYPTPQAAERSGRGGGCGVLVGVGFEKIPNLAHIYVVTNIHVKARNRIVRYNTRRGPQILDLTTSRWFDHPEGWDVSVCQLPPLFFFDERMTMIPDTTFMTKERMGDIPLRHGDELFMVSRYADHPGETDNEPVVRFGTLAKVRPVVMPAAARKQEGFLAEMRSLPGHSGSPAFIYYTGMQLRLGAEPVDKLPKPNIYLLRIDCAHPSVKSKVFGDDGKEFAGFHVRENSGMACIVPAWRIAEILENDELRKARREMEDALLEEPPEEDLALDTDEDEFIRLRNLARHRLAVPEAEADETDSQV